MDIQSDKSGDGRGDNSLNGESQPVVASVDNTKDEQLEDKKKYPTLRKMYRQRMEHEGRLHILQDAIRKYTITGVKYEVAMTKAMSDLRGKGLGPKSLHMERKLYDNLQNEIAKRKEKEGHNAHDQQQLIDNASGLLNDVDIDDLGLPEDVAWVYINLYRVQGLEQKDWQITAEESPSAGSWGMLIWASRNPDKFYDKVVTSQIKRSDKISEEKDGLSLDDKSDIELMEKMIRAL